MGHRVHLGAALRSIAGVWGARGALGGAASCASGRRGVFHLCFPPALANCAPCGSRRRRAGAGKRQRRQTPCIQWAAARPRSGAAAEAGPRRRARAPAWRRRRAARARRAHGAGPGPARRRSRARAGSVFERRKRGEEVAGWGVSVLGQGGSRPAAALQAPHAACSWPHGVQSACASGCRAAACSAARAGGRRLDLLSSPPLTWPPMVNRRDCAFQATPSALGPAERPAMARAGSMLRAAD